jgi:tRNA(Ile)-lysidine synthase
VEQLYDSLDAQTGRVFQSETHEVAIDRGRIVVEKRHEQPAALRIPETGTYCYGDVKFRFEIKEGREVSKLPDCATLDADVLQFPVTIRPVQMGDRFCPFGMKGSRLVSDYLTDKKRTVFEKRRQLAVCSADGQLAWLVGERTDQRFAVGDATRRVLSITMLKNDKTE